MVAFEEIEECVPSKNSVISEIETKELAKMISDCLKKLPETERNVFVRRYYYFDSVADICEKFGFSKSKTSSLLHRTRKKILSHLEKEGVLGER